jgi:GH25 family lysozyme M1 (1,4-beta-N-acetylmuramidase)
MKRKIFLVTFFCLFLLLPALPGVTCFAETADEDSTAVLSPEENDPGYERLSGLSQPALSEESPAAESSTDLEGGILSGISSFVSGLKGLSSSSSSYTGKTYTHASDFDGMNIYNGIDISYFQGTVDFDKVKNDGIDYVILRLGYRGYSNGSLMLDSKFTTYVTAAAKAGLPIGVYFWTEAVDTQEAQEEAEYVVQQLEPYKSYITMPVTIDWELNSNSRHSGLSKEVNTAICTTFCDTVAAYGYTPMIYANISDLNNNLEGQTLSQQYEIWVARYNNIVSNSTTHYYGNYSMWQYASDGSVDGISGKVDMDFWYTSGSLEAPFFAHSSTAAAVAATPEPQSEDIDELNDVNSFRAASASKKITLSWSQVKNADGYDIYRRDTYDGSYQKINTIANGETTSWKDVTVAKKHEYYYKIRAYHNNSEEKIYSEYSTVTAATKTYYRVGVAKTSAVVLYKTPSSSAKKLITLVKGSPVEYVGRTYLNDGNSFHHFRYYTPSKTYDGYRLVKSSITYYTQGNTTARLNLRKTAGVTGKLITSLPKGTPLPLLGTKKVGKTTWYKVCYATKKNKVVTGYVAGSYITKP